MTTSGSIHVEYLKRTLHHLAIYLQRYNHSQLKAQTARSNEIAVPRTQSTRS